MRENDDSLYSDKVEGSTGAVSAGRPLGDGTGLDGDDGEKWVVYIGSYGYFIITSINNNVK